MEVSKQLDLSDVELKFDDHSEAGTFSGYATKFNSVDLVGDTILPGAFTKALENIGTLPIFFNHNSYDVPIGKYTKVEQNARGLKVEGQLILDIPKAQDVYSAMKAGVVSGLSIGFSINDDGYEEKEDRSGLIIKEIAKLREISICTYPCEPKAQITAVKSEDVEQLKTVRDFERFLRDSGFSKSVALAIVSRAKQVFADDLRDSEKQEKQHELDALERLNSYL
jgi:HK97 family phage prohead protease